MFNTSHTWYHLKFKHIHIIPGVCVYIACTSQSVSVTNLLCSSDIGCSKEFNASFLASINMQI